jgi:hypothetical protein
MPTRVLCSSTRCGGEATGPDVHRRVPPVAGTTSLPARASSTPTRVAAVATGGREETYLNSGQTAASRRGAVRTAARGTAPGPAAGAPTPHEVPAAPDLPGGVW